MEDKTFTVTEINGLINKKLKMDPQFKNILVKGEISNFNTNSFSGHSYFTLKDEKSQISAVMFKNNKDRFLKFEPKDGMKVIIKGKIEVYAKSGRYQLYATRMTEDGVGDLHVAFDQLKKKLNKEGLFRDSHKKEIPKFPERIGVVTAPTGAAIQDIITTIQRRYPLCEVLVFPTLVQGDQAAAQIVRQIRKAEKYNLDTLIVGRGGGSIEDLWPFNEEIVARSIYECSIPTISAVGHEIDYTISDFVADKRAVTPTAAAELAVPEINELKYKVKQLKTRVNNYINDSLSKNKLKLDNILKKQIITNPESIYEYSQMNLDHLTGKLNNIYNNILTENKSRLELVKNSDVLKNPERIFKDRKNNLESLINTLNYSSKNIITDNKNRLELVKNSNVLKNPDRIFKDRKNNLETLISSLNYSSKNIITDNKNRLELVKNSNVLKNPERIFKDRKSNLETLISSLNYSSKNIITDNKNRLNIIKNNNALKDPMKIHNAKESVLKNQVDKIFYSSKDIISENRNKLNIVTSSKTLRNPQDIIISNENKLFVNVDKLKLLNPLLTLKRGYSIAKKDDKVISSSKDLKSGDEVDIEFEDGKINTKVI